MFKDLLKNFYYKKTICQVAIEIDRLWDLRTNNSTSDFALHFSLLQKQIISIPFNYYQLKIEATTTTETLFNQLNSIPDGSVKRIYFKYIDLVTGKVTSSALKDTDYSLNLVNTLRSFLDELLDALSTPVHRYTKRLSWILGILIASSASFYTYRYLQATYVNEVEAYSLIATSEARYQKRLSDILMLKVALEKYFEKNKAYPKSSGGWDGIASAFGQSKEDWIPGLVPEYVDKLPSDPRKSQDPRKQYLYQSDGVNFKLISHNPEEMSRIVKEHPELVDPIRSSWSFGVWSESAKNW